MEIGFSFLRRKVSRRILLQFVLCALIPILALAAFSFYQVKSELERQGIHRLHGATRSLGTALYDRLVSIENDLKILSLEMHSGSGDPVREIEQRYLEHIQRPLEALALVTDTGETISYFGKDWM